MTDRRRITIRYDGAEYAVADRTLDDVIAEIDRGLSGDAFWMSVHTGEGRSTPAQIWIAPGIAIGVWEINSNGAPSPRESPESA